MVYEYYNMESIDSKYWGKHTWIFLNSIALTYDNKNKQEYIKFLNQLQYVLPCKKCNEHFRQKLLLLKDSDMENKDTFLNWLIMVRNSIYTDQQRPLITKEDSINEIFNNCNNNKIYNIIYLVIFIIFFILLFKYINIKN